MTLTALTAPNRYRRVFLITGQERKHVRDAMGAALQPLGPVAVLDFERLRPKTFQPEDLVVADVRFASHARLAQVRRLLRHGPRYVEVRAGTGGIYQQTLQRLGA